MAKNIKRNSGKQLSVACTQPATPASGDPVLFGDNPGVALTDERTDGTTSVQFAGTAMLSVKGIDGSGSSAVAAGDSIYYTAGDTPHLNKKTTGTRFGTAMAAVSGNGTATIEVRIGK